MIAIRALEGSSGAAHRFMPDAVIIVLMALLIDTSKPFLRPSQLRALVLAVRQAQGHEESRWLEWKSTLDLAKDAGISHIVKNVVGFANRDPIAARHHAEGYAYLLVGVEPGKMLGVIPVDPEKLVARVGAVASGGVRWYPEYIRVEDIEVLIIIVEPPRPGDEMHHLRKQCGDCGPGSILVRHSGRTDPATPADIQMLQQRLLNKDPSIDLEVTAEFTGIEQSPKFLDDIDKLLDESRERLSARHLRNSSVRLHGISEVRTTEEYEAEVNNYLNDLRAAAMGRVFWSYFRHKDAQLRLRAVNRNDFELRAVRLEIRTTCNVSGFDEEMSDSAMENDSPGFPEPPKPLGAYDLGVRLSEFSHISSINYFGRPRIADPGFRVTSGEVLSMRVNDFDLRPGDEVLLTPIPLFIYESQGMMVDFDWSATASGVKGRLNGRFKLMVTESSFDMNILSSE